MKRAVNLTFLLLCVSAEEIIQKHPKYETNCKNIPPINY